jgi:hypothetical protein
MTERQQFRRLISQLKWRALKDGTVIGKHGRPIGHKRADGYVILVHHLENMTSANGVKKPRTILAHRFVFFFFTGVIPDNIDHMNGNKSDNSIDNLRSVTNQENHFNRLTAKGYYRTKSGRYVAQITVSGKTIYLGTYDDASSARAAYLAAKEIYHTI